MYLWTITFTKHITNDLSHVFYFIMNLYFAPFVTVSLNWFVECIWIKSSSCVLSLFVYVCHNEKYHLIVAQKENTHPLKYVRTAGITHIFHGCFTTKPRLPQTFSSTLYTYHNSIQIQIKFIAILLHMKYRINKRQVKLTTKWYHVSPLCNEVWINTKYKNKIHLGIEQQGNPLFWFWWDTERI